MPKIIQTTLLFVVIVLCFVINLHLGLRGRLVRAIERPSDAFVSYLPSAQVMTLLSVNYRTFAADLLWIRALQFHDGQSKRRVGPQYIAHYGEVMLALDPDFKQVYQWAGTAILWAPRKVSVQDVELANGFLRRGMERYPLEYYWPYHIGTNYAFWTPLEDKELKDRMMVKGAHYLERAIGLEGAPKSLPMLIANLLSRDDERQVLTFLEQAYLTTRDPEERALIERRLRQMGNQAASGIEQRQRQRQRWHREQYSYIPQATFYILGARQTFDPTRSLLPVSLSR